VRRDLSLSQQVVQACHACIEATRIFLPPDLVHPHLIVLGARSEIDLACIAARLDRNQVRFRKFCEPDLGDQWTALATELVSGNRRALFKRYQCWTASADRETEPALPLSNAP